MSEKVEQIRTLAYKLSDIGLTGVATILLDYAEALFDGRVLCARCGVRPQEVSVHCVSCANDDPDREER